MKLADPTEADPDVVTVTASSLDELTEVNFCQSWAVFSASSLSWTALSLVAIWSQVRFLVS